MTYSPINYAALKTEAPDFSWISDAFKNALMGYQMAGEPARINRADMRDKVDTKYYEPTKQEALLKEILGNKRSEATLPYAGPQAAADVASTEANTETTRKKLPLIQQEALADILYKTNMAKHLSAPAQQKLNQFESAKQSYVNSVNQYGENSDQAKTAKAYMNRVAYGANNVQSETAGANGDYSQLTKPQLNKIQTSLTAIPAAIRELQQVKGVTKYLTPTGRAFATLGPYANLLGAHSNSASEREKYLTHGKLAVERLLSASNLPKVKEAIHLLQSSIMPLPGETAEGFSSRIDDQIANLQQIYNENTDAIKHGIPLTQKTVLPSGIKSIDQLMNSGTDLSRDPDPRIRALAAHLKQAQNKYAQITNADIQHTAQKYGMSEQQVIAKLKSQGRI